MSAATGGVEPAVETLRLEVGAATEAAGRDVNQDVAIAIPLARPGLDVDDYLLAIADGMGGHPAGDVASHIAVDTVRGALAQPASEDISQLLKQAYRKANDAILSAGETEPTNKGMGTTLTAAVIRGKYATIANVGDSRAYLLRGNGLTQISRDHTVTAEDLAARRIDPEAARTDPRRNILTHAVGTAPKLDSKLPNVYELTLLPDDRLLLCSDGLYSALEETDLRRVLSSADAQTAARELVRLAQQQGTSDNASAAVAIAVPTRIRVVTVPAPVTRTGGVPGTAIAAAVAVLLIMLLILAVFILGNQ
ncbi:MAG: protein phosphatase 2C domain-containing protein [Thermomicrobiales bacterium]